MNQRDEGTAAINDDAWYQALFERAPDGMFVADGDGLYLDANPAAALMFGVDREGLIGQRAADFVVDDFDGHQPPWSAFAGSDGERGRVHIRRGDGRVIVCEYHATPTILPGRHLSTMRDVTAELEAEQQRELSEQRFRRMLDALDLLALVTDVDGRATFMNQAMLSRLGLQLVDVVGQRLTARQPGGDAQHEAFLAAVASEQLTPDWENEIITADGSLCRIRWSSAFVRDGQGRVEAVASIGEDITVRSQLEEQVRHAVRVESLGRLAGGVAHDFNNFLMIVSGHAELLASAPELSASSHEHLDSVMSGIERAARLTRQLLAYGRQQVMDAREVSVVAELEYLRTLLAPMLGAAVTVELVNSADSDVVFIDPAQLDQVIVNLALNASDAMPHGGTLRFEVGSSEIDEAAGARFGIAAGRYVELTVSDTGSGIPSDLLAHVFEPFVTTKPVGEGTGLGLSTAYGIVTQCEGIITVESPADLGAVFTIYLPMRTQSSPGNTSIPAPRSTPTLSIVGPVLVVEDDEELRSLMKRVLVRHGYDVETHESPLDALASIERRTPTLVITDVVMRDLDGFQLAERVKALNADIPVLLMSGYADPQRWSEVSRSDHSLDLLAKPFTIDELLARIRAAIDRG